MRYLYNYIDEFSAKKMLFITGPRQVGKTELLKRWLTSNSGSYLNYDILEDREQLLSTQNWPTILPVSYTHLTLPTNREV